MKYKNIIFDFGNVIGKFKGDYILGKFASTPEDYNILADAIFKNWVALDAGTIDYDQNAEDTIAELPDRLKDTARDFFENWFQYVDPLPETWKFIKELKARGVPIYLLSNAQRIFTEPEMKMLGIYELFDGILYSSDAGVKKPSHYFFEDLFEKYGLKKEDSVMIGNEYEADILGADAFGITSMYVHTSQSGKRPEKLPDGCMEIAVIGEVF